MATLMYYCASDGSNQVRLVLSEESLRQDVDLRAETTRPWMSMNVRVQFVLPNTVHQTIVSYSKRSGFSLLGGHVEYEDVVRARGVDDLQPVREKQVLEVSAEQFELMLKLAAVREIYEETGVRLCLNRIAVEQKALSGSDMWNGRRAYTRFFMVKAITDVTLEVIRASLKRVINETPSKEDVEIHRVQLRPLWDIPFMKRVRPVQCLW
jgi:8-oxo-dGTP pyrophosphatase MutT (NUDIX family)